MPPSNSPPIKPEATRSRSSTADKPHLGTQRIVLISCVSKKRSEPAKARDLYISPLFQMGLQYAQSSMPDAIYVLSAKYGLVELDQPLSPYEDTLNGKSDAEIRQWAHTVVQQLGARADLEHDEFIILAGERYRRHLVPHLQHVCIPMEGLGIGKQLGFLKQRMSKASLCEELHTWACSLSRFHFPLTLASIPRNGIYVLFERGETAHGGDRIVRVGTHTGQDQLRSRLKQHFIVPNKDRSIFRKNIGRALLNRDQDPFAKDWELDLTSREAKTAHGTQIDMNKLRSVEDRVSEYIQSAFSFSVIRVRADFGWRQG
jgi:hypothetical protein